MLMNKPMQVPIKGWTAKRKTEIASDIVQGKAAEVAACNRTKVTATTRHLQVTSMPDFLPTGQTGTDGLAQESHPCGRVCIPGRKQQNIQAA